MFTQSVPTGSGLVTANLVTHLQSTMSGLETVAEAALSVRPSRVSETLSDKPGAETLLVAKVTNDLFNAVLDDYHAASPDNTTFGISALIDMLGSFARSYVSYALACR